MQTVKKLKLKTFHFHPITTFIILTVLVVLVSALLSVFNLQTTYSKVNQSTLELEPVVVSIENMLSFDGFKFIISEAARNFISFAPLSSLLISLIGISVAHATGLIDTFIRRITINMSNKLITFIIIFLATISTIINEIGFVILIPLAAAVFLANKRSPILGIVSAFCGVAFSYGTTLFAGIMEVNLIPITSSAARLVDPTFHVSLTSNLFILIATSIILSLVGTYIVENILVKRIGKYKNEDDSSLDDTKEIEVSLINGQEQKRIEMDYKERKGLKYASFASLIVLLLFIYMIVPGLPFSGMLLDMSESTYINQLFGSSSYFQDGFTYMVAIFFLVVGFAYAAGSKSIKNDKDLIEKISVYLKDIGYIIIMIFFASQFIAIFKKTNIGTFIVSILTNAINDLSFSGVPLVLLVLIFVAIAGLFLTSSIGKWTIMAPVVVPLMMQSNISPQFAQFVFRAGDSMTRGFTPILAYFVIYLAYLNIYNPDNEPITIKKALSFVFPYGAIMFLLWIVMIVGVYLLGLPIGPGVGVGL